MKVGSLPESTEGSGAGEEMTSSNVDVPVQRHVLMQPLPKPVDRHTCLLLDT